MSDAVRAPRALVVTAHPDDAEILLGGTLFQLKAAGWQLGIITMTAGDCGSAVLAREEIARIRRAEARAAAEYLGASYACAELRDIEVFANAESIRRAVELMRRFAPDVVITHSPSDYMLDHEETSRIARSATFALSMPLYETQHPEPARPTEATPALYYADPIEGTDARGERVPPHFYVDITAAIDQKLVLLAHHKSQRDWLRAHHGVDEYLDQTKRWAAGYGAECGCEYAEGLRQHLGHGYRRDSVLQHALGQLIKSGE